MTDPLGPAGFWPRLAATGIDYAIIAALSAAAGAVVGGVAGLPSGEPAAWSGALAADPYVGALVGLVAGFALVGAVYMSLEAWGAATPGKRILGLAIVGRGGGPASAGARVVRYLAKNCHLLLAAAASVSGTWLIGAVVPVAVLVVVAGGMLMLANERRALHDVIADTAVVRIPAPPVNP